MSTWNNNSLACIKVWIHLKILNQHNKLFKDAGDLKIEELSFWNQVSKSESRIQNAKNISKKLDEMFILHDKASYPIAESNAYAIENMFEILKNKENTLFDLATVVKDHYNFRSELKSAKLVDSKPVRLKIIEFNENLIYQLSKNPRDIYQLESRKFEILIADLLSDMGFEIKLTPATRDQGRDILAKVDTPLGELLTIVDCKRYSENRKVGIGVVRNILWTLDNIDKASCAMIVTSSSFSKDSRKMESNYTWKLKLKDFDDIHTWLKNFGSMRKNDNAGLWLPSSDN